LFLSLFIKNDEYPLNTYQDTIISFNYDLVLEGAACIYNYNRTRSKKERHKFSENTNLMSFNTIFGKSNIIVENINPYFVKNRPNSYFPPNDVFQDNDTSIKCILFKNQGKLPEI